MDVPRLSVCVPLFNKVQTVERCLGSVLVGAPKEMEVVVFDNGSTDGSTEVIARMAMAESRIRHVRLEHTIMVQESWRMAFLHGRGELLKLHSADDELHPGFWEAMLPPLEDPAVEFTMCGEEIQLEGAPAIDVARVRKAFEKINATCRQLVETEDVAVRARQLVTTCGGANFLGNIYKVVVRRSSLPLARWGMVTPAYPMPTSYPDWDFLLRLVLNHRGKYVDRVLSRYWITPDAPIARLATNPALMMADAHQLLLMVLTVLGDPTLVRLRKALSQAEIQGLHKEAVNRLTRVVNMSLAMVG